MAERQDVPIVRARNRGQITSTLERWATAYRAQNPERFTRYVYSPETRPELSGVLAREAAGYRLVRYEELGIEFEGMKPDDVVRVADLVLMSIDKKTSRTLAAANNRNARDAMTQAQSEYYSNTEQLGDSNRGKSSGRPGIKPVGSTVIAEKAHQYDIEQRSGGEDG